MAINAENIYQQYLDDSGNPLNAGTLEFREAGTTTKKAIYTTSGLTTQQSNPYTLDAAGRTVGDVWLSEDGYYDVLVKDSTGATIRTLEDVGNNDGTTSQTIANTKNRFRNPSMIVGNGSSGAVTSSFAEYLVDHWRVKATNSSAGTVQQDTSASGLSNSGYALEVNGLTTSAGGTVVAAQNITSKDIAPMYNNTGQNVTISFRVSQNSGVSLDYTIYIYSADVQDNFSAVTLRSTSAATSVSTSDATLVKHTVDISSLTDAENGIQVWCSCACGAVTTKDFKWARAQIIEGDTNVSFSYPNNSEADGFGSFSTHDHSKQGGAIPPGGTDFMNNVEDMYFLEITSAGAKTHGPTGWTTAESSTGVYTITHSLGDADMGVIAQPQGATFSCDAAETSNNVLTYSTRNSAGALTSNAAYVWVIVHDGT